MQQDETTTSFSNGAHHVRPRTAPKGAQGNPAGPPLKCARCGQSGARPSSCWCSAISTTIILTLTALCVYLLYLVVYGSPGGPGAAGGGPESGGTSSPSSRRPAPAPTGTLRLVSVLGRHGDRAPTSPLPPGDNMEPRASEFWPRGLGQLTDSGRLRMFRLGLELRRRYASHLDFDAAHFLAFSSRKPRCRESLELTLRGLFQLDVTSGEGLELAAAAAARPELALNATNDGGGGGGSNSPLEFKRVAIDTQTVPSLSYGPEEFPCEHLRKHASLTTWNQNPLGEASRAIRAFRGFKELEKILSAKYRASGANFTILDLTDVCGTVNCELQLRPVNSSLGGAPSRRHYLDWVLKPASDYTKANVSLFDLCDQVSALAADRALEGTSERLQLGPILASLIASQEAALDKHAGHLATTTENKSTLAFDASSLYSSPVKKMVLYSSHDSIVQPLLYRLGIGRLQASGDSFEATLANRSKLNSDTDRFLAGLGMSKFGISLVFELYESPPLGSLQPGTNKSHPERSDHLNAYVQVALYNEEDPRYKPIEYRRLAFGRICEQLFQEQHPGASARPFYKQFGSLAQPIDEHLGCPFELLKNVTAKYRVGVEEFNKLCNT